MLPIFAELDVEAPSLPPKIELNNDLERNQKLTFRKRGLQLYLRQVIEMLSNRMPPHLMIFLGLHEQSALGFKSMQQVQKLSKINLVKCPDEPLPEVTVPESKIQFFNDLPKNTYILVTKYKKFNHKDDD